MEEKKHVNASCSDRYYGRTQMYLFLKKRQSEIVFGLGLDWQYFMCWMLCVIY